MKLKKRKEEAGFTLLEVMVVVALIAILAALAVPMVRTPVEGKLQRDMESMFYTMVKARATAMSEKTNVIMCFSETDSVVDGYRLIIDYENDADLFETGNVQYCDPSSEDSNNPSECDIFLKEYKFYREDNNPAQGVFPSEIDATFSDADYEEAFGGTGAFRDIGVGFTTCPGGFLVFNSTGRVVNTKDPGSVVIAVIQLEFRGHRTAYSALTLNGFSSAAKVWKYNGEEWYYWSHKTGDKGN
jgi:prepilin-type N-terminal cleavage/methylation domain-containing protein